MQKSRQGFTYQDFASVLNKYKYRLNIGDITAGTIFSKEKQGFLVDIGGNVVGYLPKDEINLSKYKKTVSTVNHSREFFILACNKKTSQLILSTKRLDYMRGWERIKQLKDEDIILNVKINRINKGGLITTLEGIQGFIPNSHIGKTQNKEILINQTIKCQLLFVNEKTNTLILSHKRAKLKNMMTQIYIGKKVKGIIKKIQPYGIFISVQDFLALMHISELAKIDSLETEQFHIGNYISIQIIHIDMQQGRLSVSRKYLD